MSDGPSIKIAASAPASAEVVALGCFVDSRLPGNGLAEPARRALSKARRRSHWEALGRRVLRAQAAGGGPVLTLHGLGRREDFDTPALLGWLDTATETARREGASRLALVVPDHDVAASATAVLARLGHGGYRFDRFREKAAPELERITVIPPDGGLADYRRAADAAAAIGEGARWARDLGNTPPNEADPAWMASAAREMARGAGMKAMVLGRKELERRRMGGILAVSAGSAKEPRLVRLSWGSGKRTISLVGKGVTFDTGGISLKPPATMDEMKYDKCGACTVLGIARAAAALDLPYKFRVYVPLVENMPDGNAYRPGDIVRCYNGKTVEILNTDAEGRMILADALSWAAEEKPDSLVEMSTLTGACVVALGNHGCGLYAPDDGLAGELLAASQSSGERAWRMPMWPEFADQVKGNHADLRNVAGRWGGANTAAAFLSNFVGDVERWAHLDIAGTSWTSSGEGQKGATGAGVSLVSHWLIDLASA